MIKHDTRVIVETEAGETVGYLDFDYTPDTGVYFCRPGTDDCIFIPSAYVKDVRPAQEG